MSMKEIPNDTEPIVKKKGKNNVNSWESEYKDSYGESPLPYNASSRSNAGRGGRSGGKSGAKRTAKPVRAIKEKRVRETFRSVKTDDETFNPIEVVPSKVGKNDYPEEGYEPLPEAEEKFFAEHREKPASLTAEKSSV